jgi:hypothetical protein
LEHHAERIRVGYSQIITGEEPDARPTTRGFLEIRLEQLYARELDEGSEKVCFVGAREGAAERSDEVLLFARNETGEINERRRACGVWGEVAVLLSRRDDAPHAPARVIHVARKPRDDMNMDVHDGLTGCLARVEPDIEALRPRS